jgi:hypothetical protein
MLHEISGLREGLRWPGRGETIELPDDEAKQHIAAGSAEPVEDEAATQPEPVVDAKPEPETATATAKGTPETR